MIREPFELLMKASLFCALVTVLIIAVGFIKNLGLRRYLSKAAKPEKVAILVGLGLSFAFFVIGQFYIYKAQNGIVINEVCSDNVSIKIDEYGECLDYIELFNPSSSKVSLKGYMLSRDSLNLAEFCFEEEELEAHGYLIVPFKLSKSGEAVYLANSYGEIIDEVIVPELENDTAYARVEDASLTWQCKQGTPARSNNANTGAYQVAFSVESGFYEEEFSLTLEAEEGMKIYYTIDGSVPNEEAILYEGPIDITDRSDEANIYSAYDNFSSYFNSRATYEVDKATVIRAVAYDELGHRGEISEQVYFVDFDNKAGYDDIGIISMVVDPEDFFGDERGIYVLGNVYKEYVQKGGDATGFRADANYQQSGKEWEREAHCLFFSEDRELLTDRMCGVRIQGGSKRSEVQKNFRLEIRERYGEGLFPGSILGDKYDIKSCILRNSISYIPRDALPYELVRSRDVGIPNCKYYALFLNGEYWGLYVLQEQYSATYFEQHYGVWRDDVVLFQGRDLEVGKEEDNILYRDLIEFVENTDFSVPANYELLKERIDVQSFIQFLCTEVYICNMDFSSQKNSCMWRTRSAGGEGFADGRWRWLLYDVDFSAGGDKEAGYDVNTFRTEMPWCSPVVMEDVFMSAFMESEEFRQAFVTTFMDMVNDDFEKTRVEGYLDLYEKKLKLPMELSRRRFPEGTMLMDEFSMNSLRKFYNNREEYIVGYLAEEFHLPQEK